MPKNFEEFQSQPQNYNDFQQPKYSVDPNLFVNEASNREILAKSQAIQVVNMAGTALLSLITAPLTTAQISLQLSILAHKNKYGDLHEVENNQIMNIPKEVTPYDRRRYELIIKSGVTGTNKPFRAPVYTSYKEVFQALANQGLLGFYKGNLIGLGHQWMTTYWRVGATHNLEYGNYHFYQKSSPLIKSLFVMGTCTMIDIALHPFQLMQSRFILQNRLPNFSLYKSVFHCLKKHIRKPLTFFQGWTTHIPKNIVFSLSQVNLLKDNPREGFMLSTLLAQIFSYPFLTVLRRLQCQDTLPGMLPVRYSGCWHATKLIFHEEGFRGLYRGFLAFSLVVNLIHFSSNLIELVFDSSNFAPNLLL